ncbi:hypothetical protein SAMN03097699_0004 [Flavobacteriaceae bacterium MAR_2010_188]|nr:hypothetical protein SAMN03097699_0004 [Flavobacteriaceae bacterium MAR_2010_188]
MHQFLYKQKLDRYDHQDKAYKGNYNPNRTFIMTPMQVQILLVGVNQYNNKCDGE